MKAKTLTPEELNQLVFEYNSDPNCWPELWIAGENITESDKQKFIYLTTKTKQL